MSDEFPPELKNADNFFKALRELQPDDPDFLDDITEVERALDAQPKTAASNAMLKAGAVGGKLVINVDGYTGTGSFPKSGAGGFTGNNIKSEITASGVTSGVFEAWFQRTSCKVVFKDYNNNVVATYNGIGAQKGLSNRGGKPWTGKWS